MKKFLTATAIGAMLTAGVAIAMQTQTATPPRPPLTKAQMLAQADTRFDAIDTNKDGQLSAAERAAGMEAARKDRAARRGGPRGERMLARIDTNGDGLISKAENRAAIEARFTRMDADKNGVVGPGEGRRGWGKHGDGPGGKHGGRGRGGGMMMADTDRDGVITRAEFDAHSAARFARLDTDKDGRITVEERRAGHPRGPMPPPPPAAPAGK